MTKIMNIFHKELETMSTTEKSLEKFKRCNIEPSNDFEDEEGQIWVAEFDTASPSGRTWELLENRT